MTQGQWLRLVGKNPSQYRPGTNFGGKVVDLRNPVEQVSWEDCDLWLGRLGLIVADGSAVGVRSSRRDDDAEVDRARNGWAREGGEPRG